MPRALFRVTGLLKGSPVFMQLFINIEVSNISSDDKDERGCYPFGA